MRFVFKLSFGLIGGLLLGLSALLIATRDEKGVVPLMVSQEVIEEAERRRIGFVLPGLHAIRWLTPSRLQLVLLEVSPEREWQYMFEASPDAGDGYNLLHRFYRMRGDGSDAETIVDGVGFWLAMLTPDADWLAFVQQHGEPPHRDIFRIRTDGTSRQNLTAEFEGIPAYERQAIYANGEWIVFLASEEGQPLSIYRVPLAGGPVELVLVGTEFRPERIWPLAGSDWVGVDVGDEIAYGLNVATGEFKALFVRPSGFSPAGTTLVIAEANLWIQAGNVNNNEQAWVAMRFGETIPLWQLDYRVRTVAPIPGGEWLILSGADGIERMRVDGSDRQLIYQPVSNWQLSPDGRWLYIGEREQGEFWIKRVRVLDGHVERIASLGRQNQDAFLHQWSPDGRWLSMLHHFRDASIEINFLDTKMGVVYKSAPPQNSIQPVGWGARLNRKWQPSLLGGIGVGLMLGGIVVGRWKKWLGGV